MPVAKSRLTVKRYLKFTFEYLIEIEPAMVVNLDEIIELMQANGSATVSNAEVVERESNDA